MRAAAAQRRVAHLADVTASPGPSADVSGAGSRGWDVPAGPVVVIGGMVLDVQASPGPGASLLRGTTAPGTVRQNPGGVGRNIAEGLFHASARGAPPPFLLSAVGDDLAGGALLEAWRKLGRVSTAGVRVRAGAATPAVAAVLDAGGEVAAAVADCDTVETSLDVSWIQAHAARIAAARVVVLDGNCAPAALAAAVAAARAPNETRRRKKEDAPLVWFEPVSVAKAARVFEASVAREVDVVSPNLAELRAMARAARRAAPGGARPEKESESLSFTEKESEPPPAATAADALALARDDVDALLDAGIGNVVVTLGALGLALCRRETRGEKEGDEAEGHARRGPTPLENASRGERAPFTCTLVPALPSAGVRSLVGAGDALVAGSAAALAAGHDLAFAVAFGAAAARRAVETDANVPSSGVSFAALAADARDAAAAATTTAM